MKGQSWIRSGAWDSFWILNGIPIALIFFIFQKFDLDGKATLAAGFLLWGGHLVSPVLVAWSHSEFKAQMIKHKIKFIWIPLLAIIASTLIGLLTGLNLMGIPAGPDFLPQITATKDYVNGMVLLSIFYLTWNTYHFAFQYFGIMTIYRIKAGGYSPIQRKFDLIFCNLSYLIIIPLSWWLVHHRLAGPYFHYLKSPTNLTKEFLKYTCIIVSIFITAIMFFREIKRTQSYCLPRLILIPTIGLLPLLVFWIDPAFVAIYNFSHWLIAIGIAAHTISIDKSKIKKTSWRKSFLFYVVLLIGVSIMTFDLAIAGVKLSQLTYDLISFNNVPILLSALVGFRFGFVMVHFIYDKIIYKFSDPSVRKTIGADLLTTPDF